MPLRACWLHARSKAMPNKTPALKTKKSPATVHKPTPAGLRQRAEQPNSADALARAMTVPASELSASDILSLQRTVGNTAVLHLLASRIAAPPMAVAQSPRPFIQARLAVGGANDHFELQADRIAKEVCALNSAGSLGAVQQSRRSTPHAASISPAQD